MFETTLVTTRPGLKSPWTYPLIAGLYLGAFAIAWSFSLMAIDPGPPPEGWEGVTIFLPRTSSPESPAFRGGGGGGGGGAHPVRRRGGELVQPAVVPETAPPAETTAPAETQAGIEDEIGSGGELSGPPGFSSGPGGGDGTGGGPGPGWGGTGEGSLESWPPTVSGPVELTAAMQWPVLMVRVEPEYPELARKVRQEGLVVLKAVINERGAVEDLKVTRSIPLLDGAAVAAVSQWKYSPARYNGHPIKVYFEVRVRFSLHR